MPDDKKTTKDKALDAALAPVAESLKKAAAPYSQAMGDPVVQAFIASGGTSLGSAPQEQEHTKEAALAMAGLITLPKLEMIDISARGLAASPVSMDDPKLMKLLKDVPGSADYHVVVTDSAIPESGQMAGNMIVMTKAFEEARKPKEVQAALASLVFASEIQKTQGAPLSTEEQQIVEVAAARVAGKKAVQHNEEKDRFDWKRIEQRLDSQLPPEASQALDAGNKLQGIISKETENQDIIITVPQTPPATPISPVAPKSRIGII